MRLILMFLLLLGCVPAMAGADIPSSTKDMLHLTVTATNVRLRAGAGTEFDVLGMASRNDECAYRYVADAVPRMDSTGRPWFKLIANIQQQTELGVFKLDQPCWIRSDFVKTRALSENEAMRADSTFFRIMRISFTHMPGVGRFTASKDIPISAEGQDGSVMLPAGETFYFWSLPSKDSSGAVYIPVYRKLDEARIQKVGLMPRDVFDSCDFGQDTASVTAWKKRQPPHYWE